MDKLCQTGQQKTVLWQEDKVIQSPAWLWNCLPGEPKVSLGPGWKEASYQVGSYCLHGALSLLHTEAYHAIWGLLPQRKHVNRGEIFPADKVRKGIPKISWCYTTPQLGALMDSCRQAVNKDSSIACYVTSTRVETGNNWNGPGVGYCPWSISSWPGTTFQSGPYCA